MFIDKKISLFVILLVSVLFLTGCEGSGIFGKPKLPYKEKTLTGERGEYPKLEKEKMTLSHVNTDDRGYIGTLVWMTDDCCYSTRNGVISVVDYETGIAKAVCSRPNCTHKEKESECMARFEDRKSAFFAFRYNDYIYSLVREKGSTRAYRSALDGSDRILADEMPLSDFGNFYYYSGCLFGQGSKTTGKVYSVDGVNWSENVNYLVCFSAEDGKFHIISDALLDFNASITVTAAEGNKIYYTDVWVDDNEDVALTQEQVFDSMVIDYFSYDLTTGETVKCNSDLPQFSETSPAKDMSNGGAAFETGLKKWLYTITDGKAGFISRDGLQKNENPIEFKFFE